MRTNIVIPKKINVGYQSREDTYTGKLGYVIYIDEKGVLRKEKSWNSWRNDKLGNDLYDNEPTSGFVLNKKVGGEKWGWNPRNTYTRVYDPRGFEFEITIPNLLFILENTNSIVGKGLEGEFVYGWDGKELVLIPTSANEYKQLAKFNSILHDKSAKPTAKTLIPGAVYLTKGNERLVYLTRSPEYSLKSIYEPEDKRNGERQSKVGNEWIKSKPKFWFYKPECQGYEGRIEVLSTLDSIISVVEENVVDNYAELMDKLEHQYVYCKVDESRKEFVKLTAEEIYKRVSGYYESTFRSEDGKLFHKVRQESEWRESNGKTERVKYFLLATEHQIGNNEFSSFSYYCNWNSRNSTRYETLEDLINAIPLYKRVIYLENGLISEKEVRY